jgi:hypothetical protein
MDKTIAAASAIQSSILAMICKYSKMGNLPIGRMWICLSLLMFGCNDEMNAKDSVSLKTGNIAVEITKIKQLHENNMDLSLAYGVLTLDRIGSVGSKVNLTCISVSIGEVKSEKIYVDSVAHILPDNYVINAERMTIPVYWKMDKPIDASFLKSGMKIKLEDGCRVISDQK